MEREDRRFAAAFNASVSREKVSTLYSASAGPIDRLRALAGAETFVSTAGSQHEKTSGGDSKQHIRTLQEAFTGETISRDDGTPNPIAAASIPNMSSNVLPPMIVPPMMRAMSGEWASYSRPSSICLSRSSR
jgi:hypothetical protein